MGETMSVGESEQEWEGSSIKRWGRMTLYLCMA